MELITTRRLALRWPIESDFQSLCELWTDPRVARFMDDWGPRDEPSVREWLDLHTSGTNRDGTHLQLVITLRATATPVGWLGLGASQDPLADWSFGYAIHPDHRANGYATEALTAALDYCHTHLSIESAWGECNPANTASATVMTTAGLVEVTPSPTTRRFLYHPTAPH
ncbi:GNAT family N-acetyltransferase [Kribbella shirazensis]|uniref:RimJ/RimL family protein N-acetyltransferase n=1 Tax=Kribbella shirazensis TaxID=1105143 RepID=A0A7X5VFN6_9ACTN|nr:GNAT family N-acetyltransferase [Kribbella shirazensis]NIK59911.1 RimJ/RimL family protein N-acetyltransferase [Kribbella shirazensis]